MLGRRIQRNANQKKNSTQHTFCFHAHGVMVIAEDQVDWLCCFVFPLCSFFVYYSLNLICILLHSPFERLIRPCKPKLLAKFQFIFCSFHRNSMAWVRICIMYMWREREIEWAISFLVYMTFELVIQIMKHFTLCSHKHFPFLFFLPILRFRRFNYIWIYFPWYFCFIRYTQYVFVVHLCDVE